jgi:hypothetical protein
MSEQMATVSPQDDKSIVIKELPGDEPEDVLFNSHFGVRTIELNRPKKLHSLNGSMIRKIVPRLQEWAKSDMANVVIIKGTGPKAFCAGGDVADLAKDNMKGKNGQKRSADYFALDGGWSWSESARTIPDSYGENSLCHARDNYWVLPGCWSFILLTPDEWCGWDIPCVDQ